MTEQLQKPEYLVENQPLMFNDSDYIQFDPCEGDDAEVSCRTVRLVTARKEHPCFFGAGPYGDGHLIGRGDVYRYEHALVDGDYWGTYKVCVPCMDKWLVDVGLRPRSTQDPAGQEMPIPQINPDTPIN